ncbi:hypothetical protein LCGC14_2500740, partial [marine sediment metagenome]
MRFYPEHWLRHLATLATILLIPAAPSSAEVFRYGNQKPKTIALPGGFSGLVDPADDSLYMALPWCEIIEKFSFPVILDTGASGSLLSEYMAGGDMLDIPLTGETYQDVGIGGIETFNVSRPTGLLYASGAIGEPASETRSLYSE